MENMDDFLDMFLSMTPSPEPEIMHGGKPEHAGHDFDDEPDIKGAFKSIKGVINGDSSEDKESEKDFKEEKPEDEDKNEKKSPFCKARKGGF